jgi:type VI secretion system protein VasG
VRLSHRYIPARQLPDKAVSLLDTACARVAISQHADAARVEDCRAGSKRSDRTRDHRARGSRGRRDRSREAASTAREARRGARAPDGAGRTLATRRRRWSTRSSRCARSCGRAASQSKAPAQQVGKAAAEGRGRDAGSRRPKPPPRIRVRQRAQLARRTEGPAKATRGAAGRTPLILPSVDEQAVASVVGDWTGIPVGRMVKNEIEAVLNLPTRSTSASSASATRWR